MAPVALVVMSVPIAVGVVVVGMAEEIEPRNVNMRPGVVIGRLILAAPSMRMGHRRQLAGEVSQYQRDGKTATQHDPMGKMAGFDASAATSSREQMARREQFYLSHSPKVYCGFGGRFVPGSTCITGSVSCDGDRLVISAGH